MSCLMGAWRVGNIFLSYTSLSSPLIAIQAMKRGWGFLRDGQGKVGDTWARVGHDILNLAATGVTLRGANIHDY